MKFLRLAGVFAFCLLGCSSGPGGTGGGGGAGGAGGAGGDGGGTNKPAAAEDWTRDVKHTDLTLDLATLKGKAVLTIAAADSEGLSLEVGDIAISTVSDDSGALLFEVVEGPHGKAVNIGVPKGAGDPKVTIEYAFLAHDAFDGWMPTSGVSFLWPYFCGNLFPCKSDPADGSSFSMAVTGATENLTAVFPATIPADAPTYMPAVAIGQYTELDLGTTTAGTKIRAYHLPGEEVGMGKGTAHLRDVFDFYETTYGPYTFGDTAGSVSANWGPGAYGGMEHHPLWHVGADSITSEEVHAHEAAHGWFGNGVRIACWEDFVLSEGTVTYLAARSLAEFGVDVWPDYECELQYYCDPANAANTVALPDTCNAIDLLNDPLWSGVPYFKGAYFYKGVADLIGTEKLDGLLASFYAAHVGGAAGMQDMIDHLKAGVSAAEAAEVDTLVTQWLTDLACPVDFTMLCQ